MCDRFQESVQERNICMKTDLRVRYTQKVIQDAFWQLLKEKPLSRITVKEVCSLAQINRGTFYRHYLDCYDLMDKIQQEMLEKFEQLLDAIEVDGIQNVLVSILDTLRENKAVYLMLQSRGQSDVFLHKVIGCCYECMGKHIMDLPGMQQQDENREYNYCFLISGCCGVIEYWIHTGMKESSDDVARQILRLSETFLSGMRPGDTKA